MSSLLEALTKTSEPSGNSADPTKHSGTVGHLVQEGDQIWSSGTARRIFEDTQYGKNGRHTTSTGVAKIRGYAELMRAGKWRDRDCIDFAISTRDGGLRLLNGHHRLSAQILAGVHMRWHVTFHPVSTRTEFLNLYQTFDTQLEVRTQAHLRNAVGGAEELGISKTTFHCFFRYAYPLLSVGLDYRAKRQHRKADFVREVELAEPYRMALVAFDRATEKSSAATKKKLLYSSGALAFAVTVLKHRPSEALSFYHDFGMWNPALADNDPRKVYFNYLSGNHNPSPKNKAFSETVEYALKAANIAWEHWLAGESFSIIRPAKDSPLVIRGTSVRVG
jgi:hypothetical protein